MRGLAKVMMAGVLALSFAGGPSAWAQEDKKDDAPKSSGAVFDLPAFPADASVKQVTHVAGKTVNYTATVGSLPVRDDKGKKIGEVVFTAYTLDGPRDPNRPVTFAFNGGPGAASVYLNLGAIGPKRVQFGAEGDSASAPVRLDDNPGTWMDFSDLVFIDPIGTGFSRQLVGDDEAKKVFYSVKPDIAYLSRIVFDWLVKNGRMASPKYVVGESYGGFRAPRIANFLQTDMGVGVNGVVMVSPFLNPKAEADGDFSPMPWVVTLPSMAAANLERQGRLTPDAMAQVEAYARGQYALDLLKGRTDPAALEAMVQKVASLTGLDIGLVRKLGGRIDIGTYLREAHRNEEKIGSVYDSNVTGYDPFPWSADRQSGDPILNAIIAPTTSAMVDFVTRTVGWKVEGRYNALSNRVNELWEDGWYRDAEAVTDFRAAVANDPKMKVLVVHGYDDLSCPFFTSRLIIDQMPPMGAPGRVQLKIYPGGHMFYSRPDSMASLRRDVMTLYGVG